MIKRLFRLLFGCPHENIGWPRKRGRDTTVFCYECYRELNYDWAEMKIIPSKKKGIFRTI